MASTNGTSRKAVHEILQLVRGLLSSKTPFILAKTFMQNLEIRNIPLHLVDEPVNAMRSDVWDEQLDDLAGSIQQFGLLQPVTLRQNGDRFEVIAGHRRLAAHRKLGLPTIASIVREADETTTDAMKVHENLYRADVNPVDQAVFLGEYQTRSNLTDEELATQLHRSVAWVQSRLEILGYPDYLMEFVHSGKLSMATASVLNQISNPAIKENYCRTAAIQGLSASRAKYWLAQAEVGERNAQNIRTLEVTDQTTGQKKEVIKMVCIFDGEEYPADEMMTGWYHPRNLAIFREAVRDAERSNEARPIENTQ